MMKSAFPGIVNEFMNMFIQDIKKLRKYGKAVIPNNTRHNLFSFFCSGIIDIRFSLKRIPPLCF